MDRLLFIMAASSMFFGISMAATTYTVGGPKGGWDESTNLQAWAKSKIFVTGDTLVFLYSKSHDVVEVPKSGYDACDITNAIVTDDSGKSTVPLKKPGKRYFICGVPGHCQSGMKLEVNVVLASSISTASTPAAVPPATLPGAPLTSPSESPVSLPPAEQHSSAGLGADFRPFAVFLVSAVLVLAF